MRSIESRRGSVAGDIRATASLASMLPLAKLMRPWHYLKPYASEGHTETGHKKRPFAPGMRPKVEVDIAPFPTRVLEKTTLVNILRYVEYHGTWYFRFRFGLQG